MRARLTAVVAAALGCLLVAAILIVASGATDPDPAPLATLAAAEPVENGMAAAMRTGTPVEAAQTGRGAVEDAAPSRAASALPALEGLVLDAETRLPVRRFRVCALPGVRAMDTAAARAHQSSRWRKFRSARGMFALPVPDQGTYTVVVEAEGYEPEVVAQASASATATEVCMRRGTSVRGQVTDDLGQVVSGCRVALRRFDPKTGSHGVRSVATDTEGRYLFSVLEPGSYLLLVDHSTRFEKFWIGADRRLVRDLQLPPASALTVTATDGSGRLLPEASVTLDAPGVARRGVTGAAGSLRFGSLPPGRYKVYVVCPGYLAARQTLHLDGSDGAVSVSLPR